MKNLRAPFLVSVSLSAAGLSACGNGGAIERTDNPPPPVSACPVSAPDLGESCMGELECHYGGTSMCDPDYQDFRCVNGAFDLMPRASCNPPMPPRPEEEVTPPVPAPSKS